MKNATMLYRCPGPEVFEGVSCETTIVDEPDVEAHLADGWSRNWIEAADVAAARTAEQLAANEQEQARVAQQLKDAGAGELEADKTGGDKPQLQAVHKGRGKWDVVDGAGNVVASGLTGDEAKTRAGG